MTTRNDIERLFKAHYRELHRLAVVLLNDDETARDIVNDLFASLLHTPSEVVPSRGYLMSAIRNRCLNHIRDTDIHRRIVNLYFKEVEDYETESWPDDATLTQIYKIIQENLTPQCRRAIELRFVDGLKFAEVAGVMAISENAVYKLVRQALVIIRNKLNHEGYV